MFLRHVNKNSSWMVKFLIAFLTWAEKRMNARTDWSVWIIGAKLLKKVWTLDSLSMHCKANSGRYTLLIYKKLVKAQYNFPFGHCPCLVFASKCCWYSFRDKFAISNIYEEVMMFTVSPNHVSLLWHLVRVMFPSVCIFSVILCLFSMRTDLVNLCFNLTSMKSSLVVRCSWAHIDLLCWIIHFVCRDVRGNRAALFDGIEDGGIRASSSYSSHEIDEHENERAMDGLQDRVILLKRVSIW